MKTSAFINVTVRSGMRWGRVVVRCANGVIIWRLEMIALGLATNAMIVMLITEHAAMVITTTTITLVFLPKAFVYSSTVTPALHGSCERNLICSAW